MASQVSSASQVTLPVGVARAAASPTLSEAEVLVLEDVEEEVVDVGAQDKPSVIVNPGSYQP